MTPEQHRAAALRLDEAERTRRQIRMISLEHPEMTMADAYAVQGAWRAVKLARGRTIVGHKIGLTSKAMQAAVGIEKPDSGFLLDDMLFSDGGEVPAENFIGLRIEAELAFVLKAPLSGAGLTIDDVLDATDYVTPALEILDTRIFRVDPETGKSRTRARHDLRQRRQRRHRARRREDRAAGGRSALDRRDLREERRDRGDGARRRRARPPGDGVAWLAARMAANGEALRAGEIVLAGSFIRPIEVGTRGCDRRRLRASWLGSIAFVRRVAD